MTEYLKENSNPQGEATPTLSETLSKMSQSAAYNTRVCCPATVLKYDKDKQLADVRADFKTRYKDGTSETAPTIYSVPVAFPRAGGAIIAMPLKEGNKVLLVFSDRSLEKWLTVGDSHDPEDTRAHHLSDAIAFAGCYPFSDGVALNNNDDIIIKNNDGTEIRVKPNGHLQVLNSSYELLKFLDDFISHVISGGMHQLIKDREHLRTFLER